MSNTNTETWGNIELPGLSDEELFKKNWNWVAGARQRNSDPKYLESTKKGLEKRALTNWKENKANAIRASFNTIEYKQKCKTLQRTLRGYPVCAIDPSGKIYEFESVAECSESLGNKLLQNRPLVYFAEDGSRYTAQRRKWKGWTFFRLI
jgi:hypothetical protein